MKKIGFVIPCFPVLSETFVGVQIRSVQSLGHPVAIYAFEGHSQYQPLDESLYQQCQYLSPSDPYSIKQLLLSTHRCHSFLQQQSGFSYLSLLKQGMQLAHRVAKDGCDHLHAHFAWHSAASAIVAAKSLNISISFVTHGDDIYLNPQDLSSKLANADFVCAVTRKMQSELQIETNTPIHHLPCGLELAHYNDKLRDWSIKPKRFIFIGRLVEKKGIDILLDALCECSQELPVDIVGDGPLLNALQKIVTKKNLYQVHFLGNQTADWLNTHAHQYQALIAPFKVAQNGSQDAAPLVIKEAMILGIPIITTSLAGCNEMLPLNTAIQIQMGSVSELKNALEHHQLRSLSELNEQRQTAFQHAKTHFCSKRLAQRLSKLIEQ